MSAELGIRDYRGEGPFPAVVVLHGCIGITGHFTGIADRLSSWGYVALAVDSLGPRGLAAGIVESKNRRSGERLEISLDAALDRLTAPHPGPLPASGAREQQSPSPRIRGEREGPA